MYRKVSDACMRTPADIDVEVHKPHQLDYIYMHIHVHIYAYTCTYIYVHIYNIQILYKQLIYTYIERCPTHACARRRASTWRRTNRTNWTTYTCIYTYIYTHTYNIQILYKWLIHICVGRCPTHACARRRASTWRRTNCTNWTTYTCIYTYIYTHIYIISRYYINNSYIHI